MQRIGIVHGDLEHVHAPRDELLMITQIWGQAQSTCRLDQVRRAPSLSSNNLLCCKTVDHLVLVCIWGKQKKATVLTLPELTD